MAIIKAKDQVRRYILKADAEEVKKAVREGITPKAPTTFFWKMPKGSFVEKEQRFLMSLVDMKKLMKETSGDLSGLTVKELLEMVPNDKLADLVASSKSYVEECLVGWENLYDDQNNPVPFTHDPKTNKVSVEALDLIQPFWQELGTAIQRSEEVTVDQLVKSASLG